tara:strand:- start:657 stop:869 length:213 start_codon:yes stop_codon:yes gene_type:complete
MTSILKRSYYRRPIIERLDTLWSMMYDIPEMRERIHGLLDSQMDLLDAIEDLPYYGRTTYRCMVTGGLVE